MVFLALSNRKIFHVSFKRQYGKRGGIKAEKPENNSTINLPLNQKAMGGRRTTIACTVNHPSTPLVGSQIEEKK